MRADSKISPQRASNVRTAMLLLSIVAVFFCGIILAQYSDASEVAIGVFALAIAGFLAVSIGRNVGGRGRR